MHDYWAANIWALYTVVDRSIVFVGRKFYNKTFPKINIPYPKCYSTMKVLP